MVHTCFIPPLPRQILKTAKKTPCEKYIELPHEWNVRRTIYSVPRVVEWVKNNMATDFRMTLKRSNRSAAGCNTDMNFANNKIGFHVGNQTAAIYARNGRFQTEDTGEKLRRPESDAVCPPLASIRPLLAACYIIINVTFYSRPKCRRRRFVRLKLS